MLKIKIDPELLELIPGYIEKRKSEVMILQEFVSKNNFDEISKLSHKVKGTAASYGFAELTEIAKIMESGALEKNSNVVSDQIQKFKTYVETVTWE